MRRLKPPKSSGSWEIPGNRAGRPSIRGQQDGREGGRKVSKTLNPINLKKNLIPDLIKSRVAVKPEPIEEEESGVGGSRYGDSYDDIIRIPNTLLTQ